MKLATVEYQIATYSGTIKVTCSNDDDTEVIIGKAKRQLKQKAGMFPFGVQSFRVVSCERIED